MNIQFCEGANNPLQGLVEQSSQNEQCSQTNVNDYFSSQTSINNDHFSTGKYHSYVRYIEKN